MEKSKSRISLKEIINNNIYAISLIWKNCPGKIIYRFLYSFANGILQTLELYILGHSINLAVSGASYIKVCQYLLIYIVVNVTYNVITAVLNAKLEPYFNYKIGSNIKKMLLKKTLECDLWCYENTQFYQDYTLAAAQCVPRAEATLDMVSNLISAVTVLFGLGVLSYLIDPIVLLFFLAPILMLLLNNRKSEMEFRLYKKQTEFNRQRDYCVRTFYRPEYSKEMRVSHISRPLIARFKKTVDDCIALYKTEGLKIAALNFVQAVYSELFSNLLILLYVAYQLLVTQSIQYGDCVIIVKAIGDMTDAMQNIIGISGAFRENAMCVSNVKTFMNYKSDIVNDESGLAAENGDIEFKDMSFRYYGSDKDTLKHLSFRIKKGEKVAIVGLNGAGKTTLIKLILRLYDPTEGHVFLNGVDVKEINLQSYRDMYATLLQDYHSFLMSVKENILLRKEMEGDDTIIESALHKSGFHERVKGMKQGVDTMVGKEFDTDGEILSGGEYQKLALTHVFAQNSMILILDEPSSALDPISEFEMYENISKSCKDKTVIYISHRMFSAKNADHILFMENGSILEEGSHNELMKQNGKYAELFRMQAQNYAAN